MIKNLALLGLMLNATAHAAIVDDLTPAQRDAVAKGNVVFLTHDASGSAWPKAFIYVRIEATPEEVAAVFTDFESQKNYIPNLMKSKIQKEESPSTYLIDYKLHVPILTDESYTVRDVIKSYDNGASYRVDWNLVRADTTKASEGNARF